MATIQDYKIIEVIKNVKAKAKKEGIKPSVALAKDKEYYKKALSSFRSAGICVTIISVYTICMIILLGAIAVIRTNFDPASFELAFNMWPLLIAPVYMAIVGDKIASLTATPRFSLIHLIICLIISILYIASIGSIINLIFIIIALTKYSIYKDWFYSIKTK